jgi:hypothetical protein
MFQMQSSAARVIGCLALALTAPAVSFAQAQGGGGRGMAGNGATVGVFQARVILKDMDISGDEKTKIDGLMQKFTKDAQEAQQGMRDGTADERRQKMMDLQKEASDTLDQLVAELTPEQKTAFAPKFATATITRIDTTLAAIAKASSTLDITDDQKKQVTSLIDDTTRSVDGLKKDADDAKDFPAAQDITAKANKSMADARRQLVDIIGQDNALTLMRNLRQSMGGQGGGGGGRRNGAAAKPTTAPTN